MNFTGTFHIQKNKNVQKFGGGGKLVTQIVSISFSYFGAEKNSIFMCDSVTKYIILFN
jgi:hypothetical protein